MEWWYIPVGLLAVVLIGLSIPYTREFTHWFVTRHLMPYGLIASGDRTKDVDAHLQLNLQQAYPFAAGRMKQSKCRVCKTELLGWRKLKLCRKFSCYREARHGVGQRS